MSDVKVNKYRRPIPARAIRNGGMDVYDVLTAFAVTCPALAHAVKKMLCPGQRGAKTKLQDLKEAAWSLAEAIQFIEDEGASEKAEEFAKSVTNAIRDLHLCDGASEYQAANPPKVQCYECHGTAFVRGHGRWEPCPSCTPIREGTEVATPEPLCQS